MDGKVVELKLVSDSGRGLGLPQGIQDEVLEKQLKLATELAAGGALAQVALIFNTTDGKLRASFGYSKLGDCYELIGALELAKNQLLEMLQNDQGEGG